MPRRAIGAAKSLEPQVTARVSTSAEVAPSDAEQDEPVASTVGSALKMAAAVQATPAAESMGSTETGDAGLAPPAEILALAEPSIGSGQDANPEPLPETTAAAATAETIGQVLSGQQASGNTFANRRVLLMIIVGIVVLVGILVFALRSGAPKPAAQSTAQSAKSVLTEKADPSPAGSDNAAANEAAEPKATAAPEPSVSAAVEPAASEAAAAAEEVTIQVVGKPEGAQFLFKGRVMGRSPFLLKQPRGEKRTYEVMKVGYATRRIVVHGNEKIVGFELHQDVPHPDSL